jgi:hypothetical protein
MNPQAVRRCSGPEWFENLTFRPQRGHQEKKSRKFLKIKIQFFKTFSPPLAQGGEIRVCEVSSVGKILRKAGSRLFLNPSSKTTTGACGAYAGWV